MNIAIAFSPNWLQYVRILVFSIFSNNPPPITVYLFSDQDQSQDNLAVGRFRSGYKIKYQNIDRLFNIFIRSNINISHRYSKYTLYRLLIPILLKSVDRVLYLDADTVVNGDISGLYNIDMGNNLVAGVLDSFNGCYLNLDLFRASLGLSIEDNYLNAGVLLMNIKELIGRGIIDEWLMDVNKSKFIFLDQDIINSRCRGYTIPVDLAYNVGISTGLDIQEKDIKIVHYAGIDKPWSSDHLFFGNIWHKWSALYNKEIQI